VKFHLSKHAEWEMARRQIPRHLLDWVLQEPRQKIPQPGGKCIYQAQVDFGGAKIYLL
jgi:hypothetical protein